MKIKMTEYITEIEADAERDEYYASMAEHFSDFFDDEFLQQSGKEKR